MNELKELKQEFKPIESIVLPLEEYDELRKDSWSLNLLKRAFEQNACLGWSGDCVEINSEDFFAVVRALFPTEYRMTLDRLKEEKAMAEAKKSNEE